MMSVFRNATGWSNQGGSRKVAGLCALILCLIYGFAEARPMARPAAEVVDIKHNEFVLEFVKAHTKAGFSLEKKQQKMGTTTLVFVYLPAGRPYRMRGVAQYYIRGSDTCPCRIFNVFRGPVSIEDGLFRQEVESHLEEASTYLVERLKNKYHALEYPPVPLGVPQ